MYILYILHQKKAELSAPFVDVTKWPPLFRVISCVTSFSSVARREGQAAKMRLVNLTNK